MVVQHQKLERCVEKIVYCIHGQGHSKCSICQRMFVRIIFSEPQNILLLKSCTQLHEPDCLAEKIVHGLQCQGHSEGLQNQIMTFCNLFYTDDLFSTKLGLIAQHHKWECPVEKNDYCIQGQGHINGQNVSECLSR